MSVALFGNFLFWECVDLLGCVYFEGGAGRGVVRVTGRHEESWRGRVRRGEGRGGEGGGRGGRGEGGEREGRGRGEGGEREGRGREGAEGGSQGGG